MKIFFIGYKYLSSYESPRTGDLRLENTNKVKLIFIIWMNHHTGLHFLMNDKKLSPVSILFHSFEILEIGLEQNLVAHGEVFYHTRPGNWQWHINRFKRKSEVALHPIL